MSKQIDLSDGRIVTRAWDGRRFRFEISEGATMIVLRPTPHEAKALAVLFNGDDVDDNETREKT